MTETLIAVDVAGSGLIDIDATALVQVSLFLILYAVLAHLFFRPYAAFLRRRDAVTSGLVEDARKTLVEATEIESRLEAALVDAKSEAMRMRRELVEEGRRMRDTALARERSRFEEHLAVEMEVLEGRKAEFRSRLEAAAADVSARIEDQVQAVERAG